MKTKAKLAVLGILSGVFNGIWIVAAVASLYFLFMILASDGPVHFLLWSLGAVLIGRNLARTFSTSRDQVEYVDQLMRRGYSEAEALGAWDILANGGANLLLNLQQTDTFVQTERNKDDGGQ
jgi:hypothetical protein